MPVLHDLRVDSIIIGERLRPLSETAVADLAESFRRVGQIQPITVNRPNVVPRLVTGHHRLMAARALGLETITCVVLPAGTTENDCRKIEIAENLHRNDLTKDERDRHIRLLAELVAKEPDADTDKTAQSASFSAGGTGGPGRGNKGVVSKVAEQTGLSKDTVRRALAMSDSGDREKTQRARIDGDVQDRAAREIADILAEYVPADAWDAVKANLYAAKSASKIADQFSNITGQSIMDRQGRAT